MQIHKLKSIPQTTTFGQFLALEIIYNVLMDGLFIEKKIEEEIEKIDLRLLSYTNNFIVIFTIKIVFK